jgi:hypothetical protein
MQAWQDANCEQGCDRAPKPAAKTVLPVLLAFTAFDCARQ